MHESESVAVSAILLSGIRAVSTNAVRVLPFTALLGIHGDALNEFPRIAVGLVT